MVDFVGSQMDPSFGQNEAGSRVERWGSHFETSTYIDVRAIDWSAIVKQFHRLDINVQWERDRRARDTGVARRQLGILLDSQVVGHLFEIGTDTGMVLFNLGKGLQSCIGLEPSRSATALCDTANPIAALGSAAKEWPPTRANQPDDVLTHGPRKLEKNCSRRDRYS